MQIDDLEELADFWRERKLFFVGGQGKSGTTWVERALDLHPAISCKGEGQLFAELMPRFDRALTGYRNALHENNARFPELSGFPVPEPEDGLRQLRLLVLDLLRGSADPEAQVIGERTPANLQRMDLIGHMFPEARFIHVIRDVRDVAVSLYHHRKRMNPTFPRSPAEVAMNTARTWSPSMDTVSSYAAQHFEGRYLELRYEDLLADTAEAIAPAVRLLGADDDAAVLADIAERSSFKAMSGREAGETDSNSYFRSGTAGGWRDVLSESEADEVWEIAGATLERLGYSR